MKNDKQEQAKPIGVFDSDIGGLTALLEMIHQLPREKLLRMKILLVYSFVPNLFIFFH